MKAYPRRFLTVFWSLQALLLLTGCLLIPGMLQLKLEWDVPQMLLPGPRILLAALHALMAFAGMLLLGALLPLHVRHGLRQHDNKRTGWTLLVVYSLLLLTAWGVYYAGDENISLWCSVVHLTLGLLVAAVVAIHVILAKRIQARHAQRRLTRVHAANRGSPPSAR